MAKTKLEYKQDVVNAVLANDDNAINAINDNKIIMHGVSIRMDKDERDFLDLSDYFYKIGDREYSLAGIAIRNCNSNMIRALGVLGFNPLTPAYIENGKEVSILAYLKEKTKQVEDDFEKSVDIGEVNYAIYRNKALFVTPGQMLDSFTSHSYGEIDDAKLMETLAFYRFNIYECNLEFDANKKINYPIEYLLNNHKENLILKNDISHICNDKTMIPYHGVDKEGLIHELTKRGYIRRTPNLGNDLIDKDGLYHLETIKKSIAQEEKYKDAIKKQIPTMDWARKDYIKK
ncbi:MAG: hypothetical protein E7184_00390 [Erysipelotrichaceae bacterium]|nr:hypothetical protein [Erysipelotrichaceae bacterium]